MPQITCNLSAFMRSIFHLNKGTKCGLAGGSIRTISNLKVSSSMYTYHFLGGVSLVNKKSTVYPNKLLTSDRLPVNILANPTFKLNVSTHLKLATIKNMKKATLIMN